MIAAAVSVPPVAAHAWPAQVEQLPGLSAVR